MFMPTIILGEKVQKALLIIAAIHQSNITNIRRKISLQLQRFFNSDERRWSRFSRAKVSAEIVLVPTQRLKNFS
jgi:hypothetical protein